MNDRTKNKQVIAQMNHQATDPKAKAFEFFFFPNIYLLKTILASRTNGIFACTLTHKADPSSKAKKPFFANFSI